MPQLTTDARWPKLLSLAVHEFRTPLTVVSGYIRMLLKDRAGPLTEPQRRLLEEAEKSCGRISSLLVEVSDLSALEAGTAPFNFASVDLRVVLADAVLALPESPDRPIEIDLKVTPGPAMLRGDPTRLRGAFTAVLLALRRELVMSTILAVHETVRQIDGRTHSWIAVAEPSQIEAAGQADDAALDTFDEWRGGCGLSLGVARRAFEAHGGRIWSPVADAKAGAVIALPHL